MKKYCAMCGKELPGLYFMKDSDYYCDDCFIFSRWNDLKKAENIVVINGQVCRFYPAKPDDWTYIILYKGKTYLTDVTLNIIGEPPLSMKGFFPNSGKIIESHIKPYPMRRADFLENSSTLPY